MTAVKPQPFPCLRVFWRGLEVGVETNLWAASPEEVDNHLFITRQGRVFWISSAGMADISDECWVVMQEEVAS